MDYDKLEEKALDYRPKILICGGCSYPREWDFSRFRQIADKCGAVLMCDMAHISGLVAARGGIIFYRKGSKSRERGMLQNQGNGSCHYNFEENINFAVFPSLQGGPHNNHIAALAVAFKQVATPEYKAYIQQVKRNAQVLASGLLRRKCRLVTGGTDNHQLLWDLSTLSLTGKNYEKVCEMCHITLNKCAVYGDNGTISSGGVRIGTLAMTTRGYLDSDFETIADFLLRAAQITCAVQRKYGKLLKDFIKGLEKNNDIVAASQLAMLAFDL